MLHFPSNVQQLITNVQSFIINKTDNGKSMLPISIVLPFSYS